MKSSLSIIDIANESRDVPHAPICLMGVNGSGKTRLLSDLNQKLKAEGFVTMMVEANRQAVIAANRDPVLDTDDFSSVLDSVARTPSVAPRLTEIIGNLIGRLFRQSQTNHSQFVHKVADWIESGKVDPEPEAPIPAFTNFLGALSEIIGYELRVDPPRMSRDITPLVSVKIGENFHPVNVLSSGEKQILIFSILLLQKSEERIILIVDEPELHLNEALAIDVWERIERSLPKASFIYATHSLGFGTRPTAGHLFIIEKGKEAYPIPNLASLPNRVVRDLVGARISVREKDGVPIFCEDAGHRLLIADLFDRSDLEPIVLQSRGRVVSALKANPAFDAVFPGHNARCGVVDRDFMSNEQIQAYEQQGIFSLPYNDFEACLLHPSILTKHLANKVGENLSLDGYRKALKRAAQSSLNETLSKLARQIEDDFSPRITFRLSGDQVDDVVAQVGKNTEDAFQSRATALLSLIQQGDVEGILRSMKGKKLYQHFRSAVADFLNLPPDAYELYYNLRQQSEFLATLRAIPALTGFKTQIEAYLVPYSINVPQA